MVLETVINGSADAIVTFNECNFRPLAARYRCSVVRPGEIVRGLVEEAVLDHQTFHKLVHARLRL